jgi:uncharacterized protein (TIGR03437 family)
VRRLLFCACFALAAQSQPQAVVNAASYAADIAPGSIVSIFGANLQDGPVTVNGRPAPVFFTSPTQINAQLPVETAAGGATLRVGEAALPIRIAPVAPGIFQFQGSSPAYPGGYITIYLTGQGEVDPSVATGFPAPASPLSIVRAPVTATIGGRDAPVQFAGLAPGFIGLAQVNLQAPALAPGAYPVIITISGIASNAATISLAEWRSAVKLSRTGDGAHASSSTLRVEWAPPQAAVHHYLITTAERRSMVRTEVPASTNAALIRNLKAATEYTVDVRACLDADCARALTSADTARAATEEEYWAIQGRGNSYATADRLVPDGNVGSYAFRYGAWAGSALEGKVQLYYAPLQIEEKGVKIGEMIAARADSLADASAFRGVSGYGLMRVCLPVPGAPGSLPSTPAECVGTKSMVTDLNLFQAVPLTPETGGKVRLYFEAGGGDGRTRIFYLDSQDGYAGRDFHPGAATRCNTLADYSPGGPCEPKLAIGVDLDGPVGNPNLLNARQFKIFYPTQDSWLWDGKPGTAMWFTTEWADGRCSAFGFNAAYAVWSGSAWRVEYGADGCPKLLRGVQAPAPVHLGGARYKLYFSFHATPGGVTNPQASFKPMRMLYADPEATGDPALADFEDWEPLANARPIRYVWSNGALLTDDEQSRLDDFVVFAPTTDPARLIMYANMSSGGAQSIPFIGSAVLLNP